MHEYCYSKCKLYW